MGERGHARVLANYLGLDSLLRYGALIEWIDGGGAYAQAAEAPSAPAPVL
jgi:hypothetical protein